MLLLLRLIINQKFNLVKFISHVLKSVLEYANNLPFTMHRTIRTLSLPYHPDSQPITAKLQDLPWFACLDSCCAQTQRYDIITALPYHTLHTQHGITTCTDLPSLKQTESKDNPFDRLNASLSKGSKDDSLDLPFTGGALGFLGYELGHTLTPITQTQHVQHKNNSLPDMAMGLYDWAIIVDHKQHKTTCVFGNIDPMIDKKIQQVLERLNNDQPPPTSFELTHPWQSNMSKTDYQTAFNQIKAHLLAGDCYQVNLSQCFYADFKGDPWDAYTRLQRKNPTPFSAFLRYPDFQIASLSPERFLSIKNNKIKTQPIKGTTARSADPVQDKINANLLRESTKNQAENLMIVDLLRNDLSQYSKPYSVNVDNLFELASYTSVHHLVSTISATLIDNAKITDVLAACFPGGSITGAPKIRAMQIIDACEPHQRGVYCGSIGYLSFNNRMDFNIAIRTLTFANNTMTCPAGGAIVADSTLEEEYQECLDKIKIIFNTLQNSK